MNYKEDLGIKPSDLNLLLNRVLQYSLLALSEMWVLHSGECGCALLYAEQKWLREGFSSKIDNWMQVNVILWQVT